nr:MarR family EPS-associated transcriptional regulator [Ectothiorhodospira shaposhnikovii]
MDTHSDTIRLRLLRLLADNPQLTQRELAQALGVSLGATHYSLRALIDKGLVKAENFRNSQNKRAYAYLLTPKGLTEKLHITRAFLARKQKECEAIQREIEVLKKELGSDLKTESDKAVQPRKPGR